MSPVGIPPTILVVIFEIPLRFPPVIVPIEPLPFQLSKEEVQFTFVLTIS